MRIILVYTNRPVQQSERSGWSFTDRWRSKSAAYSNTKSSMRITVDAVTATLGCLPGTSFNKGYIITFYPSTLPKFSLDISAMSGWHIQRHHTHNSCNAWNTQAMPAHLEIIGPQGISKADHEFGQGRRDTVYKWSPVVRGTYIND